MQPRNDGVGTVGECQTVGCTHPLLDGFLAFAWNDKMAGCGEDGDVAREAVPCPLYEGIDVKGARIGDQQ